MTLSCYICDYEFEERDEIVSAVLGMECPHCGYKAPEETEWDGGDSQDKSSSPPFSHDPNDEYKTEQ